MSIEKKFDLNSKNPAIKDYHNIPPSIQKNKYEKDDKRINVENEYSEHILVKSENMGVSSDALNQRDSESIESSVVDDFLDQIDVFDQTGDGVESGVVDDFLDQIDVFDQTGDGVGFREGAALSNQMEVPNLEIPEDNESQNNIIDAGDNDVDSILSEIIPDYEKNVSIEVNHVYLTFETSFEKIDTIKETFIKTLKREKSEKVVVNALKDISFKIYQGEKVGIIGYNGAGKSTLLNVISGIYGPDEGYVKTNGTIAPLLSLGAGFDYNYSGRKNIFFNGAVLGYDKKFLESKLDEIIEFSELKEFIDIPIKNYSSGMLAKLGFSIATILEPNILIIDEILGVGDVNFKKKSADKIKSLMDGGTTVLLVSHSIPQIRELCDKAIWIDNGQLREFGEVNTVCDHYLKDAENASNDQLANIQFI